MRIRTGLPCTFYAVMITASAALCAEAPVNESPAAPGEWGFRPFDGQPSPTNPPAFVWRPQKDAAAYELQCARDAAFRTAAYRATVERYNCHCPPKTFEPGTWHWRFRFLDRKGTASAWSKTRTFVIDKTVAAFPMPTRQELIGRIPRKHPRLFVRPEQLPHLKQLAKGELKKEFDALVKESDRLLKNPPPSKEPPTYPKDCERKSEQWRTIWWGNRTYTIRCLNGAATLGFARLLSGNEDYGRLAKRLLMDAARWDPKGSTGYRYNDEAGMPYNYYFSRTYTFINDLLSEKEKATCREVMAVRGREMYDHLAPRHLWRPYASHSNRAWHWLGEVGIAFRDEIPDAQEWVWFAMNVFHNVYPVWSDAQGGWHEGASYWRSYIHRFTWWADAMRVAMDVDAYRKPYFSQVGYYPMYLQPPGTRGGGFGDLCAERRSSDNRSLMTILAAQARNPHWQWYVDVHGGPTAEGGYIGFIRGALPKVEARPPDDLPTSRCFRGTGLAMLNATLASADDNVQVIFKSSPFGTQSHGYESNNSFLLHAFGERLLIRTGRRDIYGSKHHTEWMWHTKSTNCISVGGQSQGKHSAATRGEILGFHTSKAFDYVAGEAGSCYGKALERFTRHILFVKPGLVVVFDRVKAPKAESLQWHLHAPTEMEVKGPGDIRVTSGKAACRVSLLAPKGLKVTQTNRFDPPPRPRVKLTEWHLTAETAPLEETAFVTLLHPHRAGETPPANAVLHTIEGGYALEAKLAGGRAVVLMRSRDSGALAFGGVTATADLAAVRFDAAGKPTDHIRVTGRNVEAGKANLPN
ncbi:MAG TPA: DUF4962 domain-containing protein [Phycisphaerae bacterium]|nr:DUF4962 domain-containing protein [Phycisphaerae bacterium]